MGTRRLLMFASVATLAVAPFAYAADDAGQGNATTQDAGRPGNRAVDDGRGGTEVQIDDQVFVTKAIEGSMAEVELADLALQKTQNPSVKEFAEQVKKDHTAAQALLSQSATREGVEMPKTISPEHAAAKTELAQLQGPDFDRRYVVIMVQEHDKDVALYSAKARTGDGDVSAIAARLVTVLNKHLDMARDLNQNLASGDVDPRQGKAITGHDS